MEKKDAYILTVALIALLVFGAVALYSAGAPNLQGRSRLKPDAPPPESPASYLQKQSVSLVAAIIPFLVFILVDHRRLLPLAPFGLACCLILLALCFVPPFGVSKLGAARWVAFGPLQFQPSEFSKLGIVFFLAFWYQRIGPRAGEFVRGFLIPGLAAGLVAGLVLMETDFGTGVLILSVCASLMFIGGARIRYLAAAGIIVAAALAIILHNSPERRSRIEAFINPEAAADQARQQVEGINAIGSGGLQGLGLGRGRQKFHYVPFSHSDFIFTIIGEELGLAGTTGVVFLFVLVAVSGTSISIRAPEKGGLILGMGATLLVVLQAIINLGVTTGLTPNKGLPLPFISYGGSNLVLCVSCIAVLIGLNRGGRSQPLAEPVAILHARTFPIRRRRLRRRR